MIDFLVAFTPAFILFVAIVVIAVGIAIADDEW